MNHKLLASFLVSLLALGSGAAIADSPVMYWGIGYSKIKFGDIPYTDTTNPLLPRTGLEELSTDGLALKGGMALGRWIGLEVQYNYAKESNTQPYDIGTKLEIQSAAAFARFNLALQRTNVYFLGGAGIIDTDLGTRSGDEDFLAAGMGIDLMASERHMLYLEAIRYEYEEDLASGITNKLHMNVLSLGYKRHFGK